MRKLRIILILLSCIFVGLLLYLLSFTVLVKVLQGMKNVASRNAPPVRYPLMTIYFSRSTTMNRIGKITYYPVVRFGQAEYWWDFIDDASFAGPDPFLLEDILAQPELHPW